MMMFINSQCGAFAQPMSSAFLLGFPAMEPSYLVIYDSGTCSKCICITPLKKEHHLPNPRSLLGFPCYFFQEGDRIKHLWKKKKLLEMVVPTLVENTAASYPELPSCWSPWMLTPGFFHPIPRHHLSSQGFVLTNAIFQCITTPEV